MEENGDERSDSKFSDYTPERKRRSMKTFLPKPKKTMKRRNSPHFVVARRKVGGIGTDSNDANILIERLKNKTRTKKVKVDTPSTSSTEYNQKTSACKQASVFLHLPADRSKLWTKTIELKWTGGHYEPVRS
jgi:hypothetical protein